MSTTYNCLRRVLLACAPLWLPSLSLGGTIHHGDLGPGSHVSDPEVAGCEPLPDEAALIPTLRTGWVQERGGQLHVLLSDAPLRCPSSENFPGPAAPTCGTETWTLNYDLPEEMQAVGLYGLAEHAVNWDLSQQSADDAGAGCLASCASMSVGASFTPGGKGPEAQLEVLSINAQCITGRILGLDSSSQTFPPPPELNGAFRAVRCD